ncbi:hypothetical protein H340_03094 [Streptomyces mobaraensis NBRC 13819 = DSM 40847]|uniref:Uncharacterized protein n=1 Tax=Streptomyces mobaraensis (strain ATCC 29032 / DSM 40847 / JCM 4168 / NBRC 13819 / NCIMB 11159 / IPCR 16-22) TaxID=1223523 RepID=M3CDN4_STRM1|nr:hypothetical protein H340_03094 [Streptomyces mobaraensis NBRC 13819 = DSM 40847]
MAEADGTGTVRFQAAASGKVLRRPTPDGRHRVRGRQPGPAPRSALWSRSGSRSLVELRNGSAAGLDGTSAG